MPPKPFRPPRPQTSNPKPRGRPHGTTSKPSTSKRTSTTPRAPKSQAARESQASRASKPRVSNTSTALSIGSSDAEEDGDGDGDGDEDEDEDIDLDMDTEMAAGEAQGTDDGSDPFSSQTARGSHSVSVARRSDDGPSIPPDLINVLLHTFFKQEGTRLHRDANVAVGRYIETFVREGVARADWARVHGWEGELGGGGGAEGGVLEVEDLERAAPQLLLDF
ncbi:hypothetical protein BUE80_DR011155 [Diplocarpon rosae]|nr:hypothetical protein BUE80_DR011155 [Diplocarpon rosae]